MPKIISNPAWDLDELVNKIGYAADVLSLLQMAMAENILGENFSAENIMFFVQDSLRTTEKQINDLLEETTLISVKKENAA